MRIQNGAPAALQFDLSGLPAGTPTAATLTVTPSRLWDYGSRYLGLYELNPPPIWWQGSDAPIAADPPGIAAGAGEFDEGITANPAVYTASTFTVGARLGLTDFSYGNPPYWSGSPGYVPQSFPANVKGPMPGFRFMWPKWYGAWPTGVTPVLDGAHSAGQTTIRVRGYPPSRLFDTASYLQIKGQTYVDGQGVTRTQQYQVNGVNGVTDATGRVTVTAFVRYGGVSPGKPGLLRDSPDGTAITLLSVSRDAGRSGPGYYFYFNKKGYDPFGFDSLYVRSWMIHEGSFSDTNGEKDGCALDGRVGHRLASPYLNADGTANPSGFRWEGAGGNGRDPGCGVFMPRRVYLNGNHNAGATTINLKGLPPQAPTKRRR